VSVETVKAYLEKFGAADQVRELALSSATVPLAAQALGVEPKRIAKTLSFAKDDGCILIVAAGDARIDNPRFKAHFGMKAKMLSAEDALRLTGHAVGGVCPFALPEDVPVYLDESLKRFDIVYPAAGNAASAVRLTPEELFALSGAEKWIDVGKKQ